jgi:hypothetical protein
MGNMIFSEIIGRSWLHVDYNGKKINFAYPPFRGAHSECFKAINSDPELIPAQGLELALLTYGAFSTDSRLWKDVKDRCFIQTYVRIPKRLLWVPAKDEFAGVFIEQDLTGIGLSSQMKVPENIDGWEEQNGIYSHDNITFVPKGRYTLGEHNKDSFVKDGFAIALLTEEGADIFAKAAYDNGKDLYAFGEDIIDMDSLIQRVAVLSSGRSRLYLHGDYHGDVRDGFSFGVSPQKISIGNKC